MVGSSTLELSIWNVFHVNLCVPRILIWLLYFWENLCTPALYIALPETKHCEWTEIAKALLWYIRRPNTIFEVLYALSQFYKNSGDAWEIIRTVNAFVNLRLDEDYWWDLCSGQFAPEKDFRNNSIGVWLARRPIWIVFDLPEI